MELKELTIVLDHIDTSIHDTGLLDAWAKLLAALTNALTNAPQSAEHVVAARDQVLQLQTQAQPHGWSAERLLMFERYGADQLLGDSMVGQLNELFLANFMNPAAIAQQVEQWHAQTLALAEQVTLLLKGLDPVLIDMLTQNAAPRNGTALTGEIVDVSGTRPTAPKRANVLTTLRDRILPEKQSTALVPADQVPLSAKLVAAAPVVLAAAGKAIELYRTYTDAKSSLEASRQSAMAKSQPVPQPMSQPLQPRRSTPNSTIYTSTSYSRRVVIVREND